MHEPKPVHSEISRINLSQDVCVPSKNRLHLTACLSRGVWSELARKYLCDTGVELVIGLFVESLHKERKMSVRASISLLILLHLKISTKIDARCPPLRVPTTAN